MFCPNCGKEIPENGVCSCQQASYQQPVNQAPVQQPATKADNSKLYNILSYIGILWLIGMFVSPEKSDPKVRFHVGQGIILSIVAGALYVVYFILSAIISSVFVSEAVVWGIKTGVKTVNGFGLALMTILSLGVTAIYVTLAIIGIINAVNGREKPLPVIGKFAFYK